MLPSPGRSAFFITRPFVCENAMTEFAETAMRHRLPESEMQDETAEAVSNEREAWLSTASDVVSVRWKLSSPRAASGYCAKGRNAVPQGTANPVLAAMRATLSTEAFSNVGSLDGPARVRHRLASRVCRAGPFRPFEPTRRGAAEVRGVRYRGW